jgi:hypothetical protein
VTPDDAGLRAAFASLSKDAVFTAECPSAERLWAGARGELPAAEVEGLAAHMADCGACAEAWQVARDFGGAAVLPAPARAFPLWWAAAAAVVLAVGLAVSYVQRTAPADAPPQASAPIASVPVYAVRVDKAPIRVSSRYALTWRGVNDGRQFLEELERALAPYVRDDFASAALSLAPLAAKYPDAAEPAFYLGVARLMSGDASGAVAPLAEARERADPDQRDLMSWYLAASYERVGRVEDARRMAQGICDAKAARAPEACAAVARIGAAR